MFSALYLSPLITKPFNPILGETYQCRIGDLDIYLELTSSKPLNINFYCISKNYKLFGYYCLIASSGANSIKAVKEGKYNIVFNDGNTYEILFPQITIKGTTVGKKLFNYKKCAAVIDKKNNLAVYMKFNPDEKGMFTSIFSSKLKSPADTIR